MVRTRYLAFVLLAFFGCKTTPPPEEPLVEKPATKTDAPVLAALPAIERPAPKKVAASEGEPHLQDLQQLTFEGENAEAYWSFDGKQLTMQARFGDMGCDRIMRFDVASGLPSLTPVSSGLGATTCSYFLPGDKEIIYASTHLGGKECPPRPDMKMGYVWALYDSYDIFRANQDGSNLRRLTEASRYDAEGTVCAKDGTIIFTSLRDGDLELYRMDADGKNVKRLTNAPGYDGGAFFNTDCTKIVWRASRPKPGKEMEDYQRLLAQDLVRPSKLELFVANADGSEQVQVTYLDAASFGPFFTPDSKKIIFSSNYGDPKGREFDLFLINVDGTNLERVTKSPGFDGFPMFSPDGKQFIFASNRSTEPGKHDTNLFLAKWNDTPAPAGELGAGERIMQDIVWLADAGREGRGIGQKGLEASGEYIEKRFKELGVAPAGDKGYRYEFKVPSRIEVDAKTALSVGGKAAAKEDISPLGFSSQGSAEGELVFAGYGVVAADIGVDEYKGLNAKGKIVVVRRFVPDATAFSTTDAKRRYGDIRYKAWVAKERGAKAVLIVDAPLASTTSTKAPMGQDEAPLPKTMPEGPGDAGILVVAVKRGALGQSLIDGKPVKAKVTVALKTQEVPAFNVVGKIAAKKAIGGPIVIGAHYDHLGLGGRDSLAPDKQEPHVGADDNASGTAAVLEIARTISAQKDSLQRDIYLMLFSAEETGVLGSNALMKKPPKGLKAKEILAMLNLDMVGRMRENKLTVIGGETADEWVGLVEPACAEARVNCATTGGGFGPSDHSPFYGAGIPVLHMFTGSHGDYHKPTDTADKINAGGAAKSAEVTARLALALSKRGNKLTYKSVPTPPPRGDLRSYNASLGTVPDYAGPPNGQRGMLLAGVRPGGAADLGGLKRGDILVKIGAHDIGSVNDLMYVLNSSKPGETVTVAVMREGKRVEMPITFQESTRPK
jgi:Tol biopolymer transport system component